MGVSSSHPLSAYMPSGSQYISAETFSRDKTPMSSKMKPWQGYAHASVVALSVWFCRETIFEALQWWQGKSPSDGLLLGFCIVLTGLAYLPIVAIHFSHVLYNGVASRAFSTLVNGYKISLTTELPGQILKILTGGIPLTEEQEMAITTSVSLRR
ncbi:unnamed protein product [Linum trigynum]|uniref:Uncharacterized protein n=1 Tax=Linum trigynum TaxID=586398 RepID=A0AAV2FBH4_9ROSI